MSQGVPWTEEEDAVLFEHYENFGAAGCKKLIPDRSRRAIYSRAARLGLETLRVRNCASRGTVYQRIEEDWKKLVAEIPEDTRTPGQILMGEPLPGRSALDKMRAQ